MNNQQKLKQLRDKHHLSYNDLARILGLSWWSIKAYFLHPGSKAYRGVSDETIDKLNNYLRG